MGQSAAPAPPRRTRGDAPSAEAPANFPSTGHRTAVGWEPDPITQHGRRGTCDRSSHSAQAPSDEDLPAWVSCSSSPSSAASSPASLPASSPSCPVVVAGGSAGTSRARPYLIIAGLVVSFSLAVLVGSTVLSALGLPQNFLMWLGIGLLLVLAVGLMIPKVGELIERPFNRLGSTRYAESGRWVRPRTQPGPGLRALRRSGPGRHLGRRRQPPGGCLDLLRHHLLRRRCHPAPARLRRAGPARRHRMEKLREHLPVVRRVAGAVLAVTTLAIAFGVLDPLQRAVPGYTSALGKPHREQRRHRQISFTPSAARRPTRWPQKQAGTAAKAGTDVRCPDLAKAPELHGHRHLAQHTGRPAAVAGPTQGQGGADRLLDLLVHQLPALAAPRRELVQRATRRTAWSSSASTPRSSPSSTSCPTCAARRARSGSTTRSRWTTTTAPGTPTTTSTGRPNT